MLSGPLLTVSTTLSFFFRTVPRAGLVSMI